LVMSEPFFLLFQAHKIIYSNDDCLTRWMFP
jgi:hypothetical protein